MDEHTAPLCAISTKAVIEYDSQDIAAKLSSLGRMDLLSEVTAVAVVVEGDDIVEAWVSFSPRPYLLVAQYTCIKEIS